MLGVDDVNFISLDDKVCEFNFLGYVIVLVPGKNGSCTKAPVDEVVDDPDEILITETPEFIVVYTGEEFNKNHVIYGLVGTS